MRHLRGLGDAALDSARAELAQVQGQRQVVQQQLVQLNVPLPAGDTSLYVPPPSPRVVPPSSGSKAAVVGLGIAGVVFLGILGKKLGWFGRKK